MIDVGVEVFGAPDALAATGRALQVMDGAVDFADVLAGESGLLELAVDVAGKDPGAARQLPGHVEEQAESGVRRGSAIAFETMAVEAPGLPWILVKGGGVGDGFEGDFCLSLRRIHRPEAARSAKIR